jgi:hypothetical protein
MAIRASFRKWFGNLAPTLVARRFIAVKSITWFADIRQPGMFRINMQRMYIL